MSADLTRSAALVADSTFRDYVRGAITEYAVEVVGVGGDPKLPRNALARAVVYDPDSMIRVFIPLCANDGEISGGDSIDADRIRRVVADTWDLVAGAVPSLGA